MHRPTALPSTALVFCLWLVAGCSPPTTGGEGGGRDASGDDALPDARADSGGRDGSPRPDADRGSGGDSGGDATDPDAIDWSPDSVPLDAPAFPDGIQAGAATSRSVILWTRYVDAAPLFVRVFRSVAAGRVIVDHESRVDVDAGGFVHHTVEGLRSSTRYEYVFLAGDEPASFAGRTRVGRFRTALGRDELEVITFAGTHGTNQSQHPFRALEVTAGFDVDFLVHAGDVSYNDGAVSLEDFWGRYSENLNDPGFRAILPLMTHYPVWDDHEILNNYDPETIDATYRDTAIDAYFDYMPVPRFEGEPSRVWTRYRWGRTAELFILDCRSERRPSTRRTPEAEYISVEQMAWLQDSLLSSDAVFKLVLNSVPITNFPGVFDFVMDDRWEGYAAQREELLEFIDDRGIEHVYWLSGDFHIGSVQTIDTEGPGAEMIEICVGPGGSNWNPLGSLINADNFFFSTDQHTATIVELDPTTTPPELTVTFYNVEGDLMYTRTFTR